MTSKYTGAANDRRYEGEQIDIRYSLKRCIHAEECVRNLRAIFDATRKPWIDPNAASASEVAEVIHRCPSGALHYERKDGGAAEPIPVENSILLWVDGPLQITGDLRISGANVDIESETRVTLCRCGASSHKPFCDNTHKKTNFSAADPAPGSLEALPSPGGKLHIEATPDGSLHLTGNMTIRTAVGEVIFTGTEAWLCRCGHSSDKPFCDLTHNRIGFQAE